MRERVRRAWAPTLARSGRGHAVVASLALAILTSAVAVILLFVGSMTRRERSSVLVIALVAWVVLVAVGWSRGSLPRRPVIAALVVTLLCAISTPSTQSGDVFSYAMYGRMVTEHHRSPFSNYPLHFEGDPMRRYVGHMWQRTPSIYGPAFVAVTAAFAPAVGESRFAVRFAYQLLALAAVLAILAVLWRRTRSPTVLAFAGLHPLVAVSVVNGGHPDALIALAVLVGVLAVTARRVGWGAFALAFAALINVSMLAVAAVIGVWAARRWTRRETVRFAAITLGIGAVPYLFLGGWFATAHEHSRRVSRQSLWAAVQRLSLRGDPVSVGSLSRDQVGSLASTGAMVVIGVLLLVVLWRGTSRPTPLPTAAAALTVLFVASAWVMPWYAFPALPLLALGRRSLLTWIVPVDAAIILIGEQFPVISQAGIGAWYLVLQVAVPVAAFAACAVAIGRDVGEAPATMPITIRPAA